jgi:lipid A 3-O-deacylase
MSIIAVRCRALAAFVALVMWGACGACAEEWAAKDLIFSPTTLYRPDSWEIRGGGFARCCFAENGFDAGLEIVAPRLFVIPYLPEFFSPRVHVGGIVNTVGHTSYGYAGLLFTWNVTQRVFIEPFVGIAVSDGVSEGNATHNAIGCTTLIHSGGNIGYRVDRHWSVMLSLEHVSNAGLCNRNVGINSYGAKVGYAF